MGYLAVLLDSGVQPTVLALGWPPRIRAAVRACGSSASSAAYSRRGAPVFTTTTAGRGRRVTSARTILPRWTGPQLCVRRIHCRTPRVLGRHRTTRSTRSSPSSPGAPRGPPARKKFENVHAPAAAALAYRSRCHRSEASHFLFPATGARRPRVGRSQPSLHASLFTNMCPVCGSASLFG